MGVFVVRRLWRTLLVLIGISVVVFAFVRALPGDPATAILGERANPEAVARLTTQLGLDKPWFLNLGDPAHLLDAQYPKYLTKVLHGDLDKGQKSQIPVSDELRSRFPATLELALAAMFFALIVGLPAGIVAALRRNSVWDSLATTISLVGVSMPVFWLGLLLSYFFAVVLGWFPPSARLSTGVDLQPVKHAMRNALLPVVTVIGLQTGLLLGGAVLTETIFSWPGLGSWLYDAISGRDYPVIQGGVIFAALVVSVVNLVVDLSYALLDPMIQYR